METTQTFIMSEDWMAFSFKRLKSFKTSRIFSPLVLLFINYLFIFAIFGNINYSRNFVIYIIYSIITTIGVYFITTKAINRYNNIIIEIRMFDIGVYKGITLIKNEFQIKKEEYNIEDDTLTENRYSKFDTIVFAHNEQRFELVPDWFNDSEKLKEFIK